MADRIIDVITPATSFDLMTMDEAKLMMGIDLSDTSQDQQIQLWIDINSQVIFRLCNRIFAKEECREEWRELNGGHRIFPSHWPIQLTDIQSVESPMGTVLDPSDWELEVESGKIETFTLGAFIEPVVVTYSGGYNLPEDAPLPLKQACSLLNVQSKLLSMLGMMAGIRMLSHKTARVMFHDPLKILEAAMGGGKTAMQQPVMQILSHYIHYEV